MKTKTLAPRRVAAPARQLPGFGKIVLPEFANIVDPIEPIVGMDPGRGYRPGQVFFANEADYHPGGYSEALSNLLNNDPRLAIQFANDSQFLETYYQEALTNFSQGWRDPNMIEDTLQFIAPAVPVGRRFEWKSATNSEEFLSEIVDDQRAIGADFKVVKYTGSDVTDKTLNRGLSIIIDLDNVASTGLGAGVAAPWQTNATAKLTRRLYRNSLRRGAAALSAAAVTVNVSWPAISDNPGVNPPDPDQDVALDLDTQGDITGIQNNRAIYGNKAFLYRNGCYRARNNPAGYLAIGQKTEEALAAAIGVDRVKISRERYQSTGSAKSQIFGANIYTFYAQDGVDTEDPSNIKRFISSFDSEQGGGLFRVYVQQISSKLVKISVEFYEKITVTYSSGIRKLVASA